MVAEPEGGALNGRAALVTGASGGIGAAIAARLAARGAAVAVHCHRNHAAAEAVATAITAAGGRAIVVRGDVSQPPEVAGIMAATLAGLGRLDILVNNSGILEAAALPAIEVASFHRQFDTNVLGVILMMQAALPHFPASGGRVVNVATNLSFRALENCGVYTATKSAVIALTETFARELGPRGITVNAVAPGATETAMTSWLTDAMRAGIAGATPLGRMGVPEDIAGVAAFLCSDDARWITGRTLLVDGGLA
jgi:3-oxoacyl-[acyl-carrier protein] reductase